MTTPQAQCTTQWSGIQPIQQAIGAAAGRPGVYMLYLGGQPDGKYRWVSRGKATNLSQRLGTHARSAGRYAGTTAAPDFLFASFCPLSQRMAALAKSKNAASRAKFKSALAKAEGRVARGPGDKRELPDIRLEMAEFLYELASELADPSAASLDAFR